MSDRRQLIAMLLDFPVRWSTLDMKKIPIFLTKRILT